MADRGLCLATGLAAVVAPVLYIFSDLLELRGGGFSPGQLYASYLAFLAVPFVVLGLHAAQRPRTGWVSLAGALAYGTAFIFFAGTALLALVTRTPDYGALVTDLGAIYTVHGGLMVAGGFLFGWAVLRATVLPRWTGIALILGVVLNLLADLLAFPAMTQVIGSMVRNLALVGIGAAVLARWRRSGPAQGRRKTWVT